MSKPIARKALLGVAGIGLQTLAACGTSPPSTGAFNRVTDGGALRDSGGGGGSPVVVGGATDGAVTLGDAGPRAAYCAGQGPPVIVGDQGDASVGISTGCIASWAFPSAVCACDNIEITASSGGSPGYFQTDAFNSSTGGSPGSAGPEARVGCISTYNVEVASNIGGDLVLNSATALFQQFPAQVGGDLHAAGGVLVNTGAASLVVDGNAWVNQLLAVDTTMSVGGTLYRRPGAVTIGSGAATASKGTVTQSFVVPPSCDCAPADLLDVPGYVAAAKNNNDNASIGLSPDALTSLSQNATFSLPCGRFYVAGITVPDYDVTLQIAGRTALMVDGPLLAQSLTIDLGPDGEIDLFVASNFVVSGAMTLGSPQRPAATRVYVGGTGNLVLQGQQSVVGNMYAPYASIVTSPQLELYGSLFANVIVGEQVGVHYDTAVQTAGQGCTGRPPPPAPPP